MTKFQVMMLAFATEVGQQTVMREVEVPDNELALAADVQDKLGLIFHYGQNDFQPKQCPSVSVGDVCLVDGRFFRVSGSGWNEMTAAELEAYCKIDRRDRYFYKMDQ